MHRKEDHEEKRSSTVHVAFHSACDYCEVLCEILIFGYHISLIPYFLDGVHGLEHNNFFLENCHKAVFIAIISFVFSVTN